VRCRAAVLVYRVEDRACLVRRRVAVLVRR